MSILRDTDARLPEAASTESRGDRATRFLSRIVYRLDALIFSRKWRQPEEASMFSARPPEQFGRVPWTAPLLVLGDNQLQHEFGEPDSVSNMLDRWSEPSVRPPLTALFKHALLERVLALNLPAARPMLHMGDALNTSCLAEFRRFRVLIEHAIAQHAAAHPETPFPFVIMPGNHDGFFLGNFQSKLSSIATGQSLCAKLWRMLWNAQGQEWRCRCADTFGDAPIDRAVFTKNDFLLEYLRLLDATGQTEHDDASRQQFDQAVGEGHRASLLIRGRGTGFFQAARIDLDPDAPNASFVVQILRLPPPRDESGAAKAPPVYLLLLDSSNYERRRSRAGMVGDIGQEQAEAAYALWQELAPPRGAQLFFACHHNLAALGRGARRRLAQLAQSLAQNEGTTVLPLAVTAHRHRGGWYTAVARICRCHGHRVHFTDLNVSSMVDWPMATRELALWGLPRGTGTDATIAARRFCVFQARQLPLFPREELERYAANEIYGQIASRILVDRRSPLRRDPVQRVLNICRDSLRDRYVAQYAILYEMGATLLILLGLADLRVAPARGAAPGANALRQAMAEAPLDYEANFEPGRALATFEALRLAVFAAWQAVDACRRDPTVDEDIARLVALGALEDYHRQWRNWKWLPGFVADRWYRSAANLEEAYALVHSLEPVP